MIIEIDSMIHQSSIKNLLSYATSIDKVDNVYGRYIQSSNQQLFGFMEEKKIIGIIGIELHTTKICEIKHIAVSPEVRREGIGSKMIHFLCDNYPLATIFAETDADAVEFYRKFGFKITTLGEKYPAVERFWCEYKIE